MKSNKKTKVLIAPSILAGDFGNLAKEAIRVQKGGADWLHIDIMDGHFVPNITIGPRATAALKKVVKIPLDVHLMIKYPQMYIKKFIEAGADILTVHVESSHHIRNTLKEIKKAGCKCGLVLNPDTPAEKVKRYLKEVDMILVMSVHPGFSYQKFIPKVIPKIRKLRKMIDQTKRKIYLQVDGGINPQIAKVVISAGADVLVAGGAVYGKKNVKKAIKDLREGSKAK